MWIPVEIDEDYENDTYCDVWIDGDRSGGIVRVPQDIVLEIEPKPVTDDMVKNVVRWVRADLDMDDLKDTYFDSARLFAWERGIREALEKE